MGSPDSTSLSVSGTGEGEMTTPYPHPLPPVVAIKARPEVMRARELILSLPGCDTQKSRPWTLPAQDSTVDPSGRAAGEQALREWEQESCHHHHLPAMWKHGWEKGASTLLVPCHLHQMEELISGTWEQESWSYPSLGAALGRMSPAALLGNTVELELVVWMPVSWPYRHESRTTGPSLNCLLWTSWCSAGDLTLVLSMRDSLWID